MAFRWKMHNFSSLAVTSLLLFLLIGTVQVRANRDITRGTRPAWCDDLKEESVSHRWLNQGGSTAVFFDEIHWDSGIYVDAGEAVEIFGPANTVLSGWTVYVYGGAGTPTLVLQYSFPSGTSIPNLGQYAPFGSFGAITLEFTAGTLKKDYGYLCLVGSSGEVKDFLFFTSVAGNAPASPFPVAGSPCYGKKPKCLTRFSPGSIFVLDPFGNVRQELKNPFINGPWGATVADFGSFAYLFVSNVVAPANGTIVRWTLTNIMSADAPTAQPPRFSNPVTIADNIGAVLDPAAVVIGPIGLGYRNVDGGQLFVSDEIHNRVLQFNNVLYRGNQDTAPAVVTSDNALQQPIGLTLTPDQNQALIVNNLNGNLVDFTIPAPGTQLSTVTLTNLGGGNLFGVFATVNRFNQRLVYFVNDGDNTLNVLQ